MDSDGDGDAEADGEADLVGEDDLAGGDVAGGDVAGIMTGWVGAPAGDGLGDDGVTELGLISGVGGGAVVLIAPARSWRCPAVLA